MLDVRDRAATPDARDCGALGRCPETTCRAIVEARPRAAAARRDAFRAPWLRYALPTQEYLPDDAAMREPAPRLRPTDDKGLREIDLVRLQWTTIGSSRQRCARRRAAPCRPQCAVL